MLQNHYGDHEFPVRPRARHARQVQQSRAARLGSMSVAETLGRMAPALVLLVVLMPLQSRIAPHLPPAAQDGYVVLVAVACLVVTVLCAGGGSFRDRSLPVREQRRYRQLTGAPDLTVRQQQLLALDSQSDYSFGGWNSSLEYAPSWRCLPEQVRRAREPRAEGAAATRPLFRTLPLVPVARLRADLDARHHIASGRDLELRVADLLSDGGVSARFAAAAGGPGGDQVLARLASLTGRDEFELRALTESVGGRPPELLRGADVQWAVSLVRLCFGADQVRAPTAWALVERAGEVAAARYGSWEEYWASVRTGVAFGSDSLDAVQHFEDSLARLRASSWPAARTPWLGSPHLSGNDPTDPTDPTDQGARASRGSTRPRRA